VGRYGFFILIALLFFGPSVLGTWLSPAFALMQSARETLAPYMLPRPWQQ
jgi:hypothetical protein